MPVPSCPICRRASAARFAPFCSDRCADIDLGRWLGERYVVTEPIAPEDEADRPADEDADEG